MTRRIWIDLANSPHVRLFAAIAPHLEAQGHVVGFTARDHAQTLPLAEAIGLETTVIGGPSPAGKMSKIRTTLGRARSLAAWARDWRPDVALSHGSYAQLVAAALARVPRVTMMDYEHQPANHLSFRLANRVVVPECFPEVALRRQGARRGSVIRYPGFKEEVYLASASAPDKPASPTVRRSADELLVLARPSPEAALYLSGRNAIFDSALAQALDQGARVVILARDADQAARYSAAGAEVPSEPVDMATAVHEADAVIGGGGTMSREAALLGARTYTTFSGELAAVDAELIRRGWLHDLRTGTLRLERRDLSVSNASEDNARGLLAAVDQAIRLVS
jgi:hypothetical protein